MLDRAMQALYLLALDPIGETTGDPNSYGFRKARSTADAIAQCFIVLGNRHTAQWVLEGDIASCFDRISHEWLLAHIPMDKAVLRKWLKAGYMEHFILHPTDEGTPQGGIISPPIMWQNAPIRASHKRVRRHAEHDVHLSLVDFDSADQRPYDLAAGLPIGGFESVLHLSGEVLEPSDQQP